ncbi:MAG: esterase/lipase family protein [Desulfovibrio sp.]
MKIALLLFFLFVPIFSYSMRWWIIKRSGEELVPLDRELLSAILSSILSMPILLGVQIARFICPLKSSAGPEAGTPVVFVHGLYHNPSAWRRIYPELKKHGVGGVRFVSYNSLTRTFHEAALEVVEKTLALSSENGQPCVLIGHSLGGLISRYAAAHPDLEGKVKGVITLATPHRGSDLAVVALGALGRSLRPGENCIADEVNNVELAPNIAKYSLYTQHDNMVMPQSKMIVPERIAQREQWNEVKITGLCHVGVLYRRSSISAVCDAFSRIVSAGH